MNTLPVKMTPLTQTKDSILTLTTGSSLDHLVLITLTDSLSINIPVHFEFLFLIIISHVK